ncbi:MAG: hypothetical protein ACI9OJ_002560 [Myxococcota bacterium]|jgi:hypothetical protein
MKRFERRDFLRLASGAGLLCMSPMRAFAAESSSVASPPYFMFFHAAGGWDPTSLCDPKGRANEEEEDPVNMYFTGDIGEAGNIRYAPVGSNKAFFDKHHSRTLVINGLDMGTNSHTVGTRHQWSGKLSEGYPSVGALIAGTTTRESPLAYVSFGGYDFTAGTVAPTRLGNLGVLERIAWPNRVDGGEDSSLFHSDATFQRIVAAQNRRRGYLESQPLLPKARHGLGQLFSARVNNNEVKKLGEFLPDDLESDSLRRQVQLTMAAFRAGLAKTASLSRGGFDTHGNHDQNHIPNLSNLMEGVDFAWDEAERQGLADQLVVVIGSDFARTPRYNQGNGKDHWSVSSTIVMGKGVPGNRVIGATTHRQSPINVDPGSLATVDSGGLTLEPKHLHRALRKLAGVADAELATSQFPLSGAEDLPIFG